MLALLSLRAQLASERGQTLAEYGILIAVIAIVVIAGAVLFGTDLSGLFGANAAGV